MYIYIYIHIVVCTSWLRLHQHCYWVLPQHVVWISIWGFLDTDRFAGDSIWSVPYNGHAFVDIDLIEEFFCFFYWPNMWF